MVLRIILAVAGFEIFIYFDILIPGNKEYKASVRRKAGEYTKQFGDVKLVCISVRVPDDEYSEYRKYYLAEDGAESDSSKKLVEIDFGADESANPIKDATKRVKELLAEMPYSIRWEYSNQVFDEFFKGRLQDKERKERREEAEYDRRDAESLAMRYPAGSELILLVTRDDYDDGTSIIRCDAMPRAELLAKGVHYNYVFSYDCIRPESFEKFKAIAMERATKYAKLLKSTHSVEIKMPSCSYTEYYKYKFEGKELKNIHEFE